MDKTEEVGGENSYEHKMKNVMGILKAKAAKQAKRLGCDRKSITRWKENNPRDGRKRRNNSSIRKISNTQRLSRTESNRIPECPQTRRPPTRSGVLYWITISECGEGAGPNIERSLQGKSESRDEREGRRMDSTERRDPGQL